jgi:hypothetical protein
MPSDMGRVAVRAPGSAPRGRASALCVPRVVLRIHGVQFERAEAVELQDRLALGRGEVAHPGRHDEEAARLERACLPNDRQVAGLERLSRLEYRPEGPLSDFYDRYRDLGLLIARLGFGLGFVYYHGMPKLMGGAERLETTGAAMQYLGITAAPQFWGLAAGLAESGGGLLLAREFADVATNAPEMVEDLITRTIEPCKTALQDAGLGASDIDEVILVGGSTRIPAVQETVKKFFNKEPHKGVNPDEVVAVGAAIQGGVLSGDVDDVVLLDVTPLTLGIETLGGVMTKLIESNTTIPTSKKEVFSTAADSQTSVEIHILQGERAKAQDNRTLGRFHLDGIPPAPRGMPQIEVTFDIDANGVLNVSARDKGTGKEQSVRIEASSGLTEEEIEKMRTSAEEHAEEDKKLRENVEKLNKADSLIFSTRKQLDEHKDKISEGNKSKIEDALGKLEELHKSENTDQIDDAIEELNQAWAAASQEIYQAAESETGQAADAGAQNGSDEKASSESDDAVHAYFEVVEYDDDDKK